MTAPTVTSRRIDDTQEVPSPDPHHDDKLVLETADPKQVRKILGVVIAFLLVLVLFSATRDDSSVALGVAPARVLGNTLDRALPRNDTTDTTAPAAQQTLIPVPTLVPIDRLVPIVIPGNNNSGGSQAPQGPAPIQPWVQRTANGPSSPEISSFYTETQQPTARQSTRFRFWAGDADGLIRYIRVDFGDGKEDRLLLPDRCMDHPSDPVAERAPFSHVFEQPGTYIVTLTVASSGSCGNGPTQTVQRQLQVQVGVVAVDPGVTP